MKRSDYWLITLILTVVSVFAQSAWASTCTSINSGNWSNKNIWDCGHVPTSTDTVVIASGFTVKLNKNFTVAALIINAGGTINDNGNNLTVNGNITVNGTFGVVGGGGSLIANGTNVTISGTGTFADSILEISNSATITSGSTLNFSVGGMIDVGPNAPPPSTVTLILAGSVTGTGQTAGNTILNGNGFSSINITGSINAPTSDIALVAGDVLINNGVVSVQTLTTDTGAVWTQGANSSLTLSGTTAVIQGTLNASAAGNTVNYTGAAQTVIPTTYFNLGLGGSGVKTLTGVSTVNGNLTMSGSATATAATALTVGGNFSVGASNTFATSTFALKVAGNFAQNGTFTAGTGVVTLNGGAAVQTISGTGTLGFSNLTVSNSGGITLARNVTVTSAIIGPVTLTSTCPIDYTLTSNGGATVQHSCASVTPGSFNVFETGTAALAITGVIKTKIAGSAFGLDVVAISSGAQASGFNGVVKVELLGNTVTGIALDAQNCPTSSTMLQAISPNPTISGGRSTVSFAAAADAWKDVRVRVSYPAAAPTVVTCSTDNFAIRPNSLTLSVTDADWQTAGTTNSLTNLSATTTSPVHKAGQPFTLQAAAANALGVTTTNYTGTPIAALSVCAGTACTATLGTFSIGTGTAVNGAINSSTATYSEVGAFTLQLQDQSFANVDAADGTTADCSGRYICSSALGVGRFVPDHFNTVVTGPMTCSSGLTCPTGGMVYSGQAFTTQVTAYNAAGIATQNYDKNVLAKAVTLYAYDALGGVSINPGGGTLTLNTVLVSAFSAGVATTSTPVYTLGTTLTAPTDIFMRVIESAGGDNVSSLRSPALSSVEGGVKVVSGRVKIPNAFGSELLPLKLIASAQYYSGSNWANSTTDTTSNLTLSPTYNLLDKTGSTTGTTAASKSPSSGMIAGKLTITLAKPTGGATGTATITPTSAPSYLPATPGTATFGVYKGSDKFIYLRENY